MAKQSTTIDKDLGARKIIQEAGKLDDSFVTIGVHEAEGSETYPNGATVSEVAFWNEFGTITAPERSFIRSTVDENRSMLNEMTKDLLGQVVDGSISSKLAMKRLGFKIETLVKKKILELNDPKNAERTIEAKGFNNPLVDSRRLWRSIAHQVMMGA